MTLFSKANSAPLGRVTPIETSSVHTVTGHSLHPPFPAGYEEIVLGMGCFWGVERLFWQVPGYTSLPQVMPGEKHKTQLIKKRVRDKQAIPRWFEWYTTPVPHPWLRCCKFFGSSTTLLKAIVRQRCG